tara:strand:- start:269 stop:589 length:321 start_codon:yes stop_codon:yes gene_type:complete
MGYVKKSGCSVKRKLGRFGRRGKYIQNHKIIPLLVVKLIIMLLVKKDAFFILTDLCKVKLQVYLILGRIFFFIQIESHRNISLVVDYSNDTRRHEKADENKRKYVS